MKTLSWLVNTLLRGSFTPLASCSVTTMAAWPAAGMCIGMRAKLVAAVKVVPVAGEARTVTVCRGYG
jgi:hypothetical protein